METIDVALTEIGKLNEKTDKLLCRTRKLIQDLDSEAHAVKDHLKRVKQMLGIPETACCICFKHEPTHCLDSSLFEIKLAQLSTANVHYAKKSNFF